MQIFYLKSELYRLTSYIWLYSVAQRLYLLSGNCIVVHGMQLHFYNPQELRFLSKLKSGCCFHSKEVQLLVVILFLLTTKVMPILVSTVLQKTFTKASLWMKGILMLFNFLGIG